MAVNRSRLGVVLERLLPDIERQKEATGQQERDIEFAKAYFSVSESLSELMSLLVCLCLGGNRRYFNNSFHC